MARQEHHWYVDIVEQRAKNYRRSTAWFDRKGDAYEWFQALNRLGAACAMGDEGLAPIYTSKAWQALPEDAQR